MTTNDFIDTINEILEHDSGYAIAKKIGVNPSQINRLKNGERKIENMSLDLASKILLAYTNVSIELKESSPR